MTKLSVNINKIATLRNARGGNVPDVCLAAQRIQQFGADGITIHPRPDQRHIRFEDVYQLKKWVTTEYNIEGFPDEHFVKMVLNVKPHQVTLVPDPPDAITSNAGWKCAVHHEFLTHIIRQFKEAGIRTSVFVEPIVQDVMDAAKTGVDRIELYTESFAVKFLQNKEEAVRPYVDAANAALQCGLGINAGHDLNLVNLNYFARQVPGVSEVSIGHALISDALYFGLENTVNMYKRELAAL
jgi:pyridoxine 5-phosphate synthase